MEEKETKISADALAELLAFIEGRLLPHLGTGITTYLDSDADQRMKHEACLELERQGKIRRHLEGVDYVVWKPALECQETEEPL